MRRDNLSRPIRLALTHEVLTPRRSVFDYGCGRGDDLRTLTSSGFEAAGWDPAHRPDAPRTPADVVNLGYVVNVIDDPVERADTLSRAWRLARHVLIVAARLVDERDDAHIAPVRDGWVTRHGTFQKFYEHDELGAWIRATLAQDPVPASLGVYYVFRRSHERESYLASRFRRPVSLPRSRPSDEQYQRHQDLLEPLMGFVADHGRLPDQSELPNTPEVVQAFGSLRRAFRVVLWVTDSDAWYRIRQERTVDLLVHLALAKFHGRPRWSDLPETLQRDVRAFFPSYRAACERADKLLFAAGNREAVALACRVADVGKLTPAAMYVHHTALNDLPALLRVYEGCARALVGTVENATLVKLARDDAQVSYLSYPEFDTDPHPALSASVVCDLRGLRVHSRSYVDRANPPILHRKELFVGMGYPARAKFARLTEREEKLGLYDEPERIGVLEGWRAVCAQRGVSFRGHAVRVTGAATLEER
jgi:DNA phosphorothioation-associated putative methyltransferase